MVRFLTCASSWSQHSPRLPLSCSCQTQAEFPGFILFFDVADAVKLQETERRTRMPNPFWRTGAGETINVVET